MSLSIPGYRYVFVAGRCFFREFGYHIRIPLVLATAPGWQPDRPAFYLNVHGRVDQREKAVSWAHSVEWGADVPCGDHPTPPGSRGTLPCPSPLRTARESFPSSRSSLSNALSQDAASQRKIPGYELVYGNSGGAAPGSLVGLPLHLPFVRYGDCSIPSVW
jgi:hypothetical protein